MNESLLIDILDTKHEINADSQDTIYDVITVAGIEIKVPDNPVAHAMVASLQDSVKESETVILFDGRNETVWSL